MRKFNIPLSVVILFAALLSHAQEVRLPLEKDSLRFAVIGDNGTGDKPEYDIGGKLAAVHAMWPFDFVVMMGDNLYGGEAPRDFQNKFEKPYQALLSSGVKFYATLGNHDDPARQVPYKPFNMGGKHYYTFKPKEGVRFFSLDSNYMDKTQLDWFEKELKSSGSEWKIVFFHHPIYSSGLRHGSNLELRSVLEPLMVKYGVDVVLSGHEHFYERVKPQKKIRYFIMGSSGQLRRGNIGKTALTEKGFDQDNAFMLAMIAGARAGYGQSVRPDLCGGWRVISIPTATKVPFRNGADGVVPLLKRRMVERISSRTASRFSNTHLFSNRITVTLNRFRNSDLSVSKSAPISVMWPAPSSSTARRHSGQKKSTMYGPMLCCRRNFFPSSLESFRRVHRKASAGVRFRRSSLRRPFEDSRL